MADLGKIVDELSSLSVIEAAELSKLLEEKWGVSATAVAAAAPQAADNAGAGAEEEKDSFDVIFAGVGDGNKIPIIREVRAITGLDIKSAKALVVEAPKTLKENAPKAEAEEIKKKLEALGANIELK